MKRLITIIPVLLLVCIAECSLAQTSVNAAMLAINHEESPVFIEGISFTPDGIQRTFESGGSKSVKVIEAPVVTKNSNKLLSAIETLSALQFKYAMMIDVEVESLQNLSLLSFIDDWFGTRYKYGGNTKRGIDCSALTKGLFLAVYGFKIPRTARQQYASSMHISKDELQEGDLVFFNTTGGVSHVGFYLNNNYFLHASSSQGVMISNLDESYFSRRYIGGGRILKD